MSELSEEQEKAEIEQKSLTDQKGINSEVRYSSTRMHITMHEAINFSSQLVEKNWLSLKRMRGVITSIERVLNKSRFHF
jgi:hypothetical protein